MCVKLPQSRPDSHAENITKKPPHIFSDCVSAVWRPEKKRDRFSFKDEEFDRGANESEMFKREKEKKTHTIFFLIMRVHLVRTNSETEKKK